MDFTLPSVPMDLFWIAALVMLAISLADKVITIFWPSALDELKSFIPHIAIIASIGGCLFAGKSLPDSTMLGFAIGIFAAGMYDTFIKPFVKKEVQGEIKQ
jgi:hypothetical protein